MPLTQDLRILYRLAFAPIRGATHQERLESFYAHQAGDYDSFRKKLLHGREELYRSIPIPDGGVWLEMGGGTGANLEHLGANLGRLGQVHVIDLAPSLLNVARQRCQQNGWTNVAVREEDATRVALPDACADVVTFSYALTMIPDWYLALESARRLLKPGGVIAVVDFYVSRKHPPAGFARHRARWFWPTWFACDNVFLSPDHVPYLHHHFEPIHFSERRGRVPYVPFVRAPYYTFLGRLR